MFAVVCGIVVLVAIVFVVVACVVAVFDIVVFGVVVVVIITLFIICPSLEKDEITWTSPMTWSIDGTHRQWTQTHRHTDTQTDISTYRLDRSVKNRGGTLPNATPPLGKICLSNYKN